MPNKKLFKLSFSYTTRPFCYLLISLLRSLHSQKYTWTGRSPVLKIRLYLLGMSLKGGLLD